MRRLFLLVLVALLCGGVVYAADLSRSYSDYASPNAEIFGASGGKTGISPGTEIIKVRYAMMDANSNNLNSGDVVSWDCVSADGVTITACVADVSGSFAGVLVTTINTADSASKNGNERNWGYMAIKGYCLASVDTSASNTSEALIVNAGTLQKSFATLPATITAYVSRDIGVLLNDTGTDGLMPVWLRG